MQIAEVLPEQWFSLEAALHFPEVTLSVTCSHSNTPDSNAEEKVLGQCTTQPACMHAYLKREAVVVSREDRPPDRCNFVVNIQLPKGAYFSGNKAAGAGRNTCQHMQV